MEFWSFWWLIFPLMFFAMGALSMWFRYKRHKDTLDLMKTYAAQGKDPAEIARILGVGPGGMGQNGVGPNLGPGASAADWSGPYGPWSAWRVGSGWRGPWGRWGPYREWRRFIVFGCLAVGFAVANHHTGFGGPDHAFALVAIIMGALAAGSLLMAVAATVIAINERKTTAPKP